MSTPPTPPTPSGPGAGAGPGPGQPAGRQTRGRPSPAIGTAEAAPEGELKDHRVLTSLLGAWALAACSPEETAAVEAHLTDCAPCAEEALRLRDAVGLPDPLPADALPTGTDAGPQSRTEAYWSLGEARHQSPAAREPWREQSHAMIRDVSFLAAQDEADHEGGPGEGGTGEGTARGRLVSYGNFSLPLRDAFLDRAFECWMHAEDIAEAVDYPYGPPGPAHLNLLVDLAARQLPGALAARRRTGLAPPFRGLATAGAPGRTLHLEVEGDGGGDWYIPLDSPGSRASPEGKVAHIALDGLEFCQLAAGHVQPLEAAAGHDGDPQAIQDVLYATASLSRL
ncbi:zf-HC2 domain-containing protein [Streptomyces sp. 891-h]|uniref:zf-HC2 domain-containing protein n=1 Tax=Streptomyces sp. 891-h TaxID=2720714 RepID=UPI001FAA2323|nr:zf-HC2 domain-containing protein [Streptomyces sp. 891-h]UNZ18756.1 zf-HC2 domain-containing protein [Streptomyces sp. 891-h]